MKDHVVTRCGLENGSAICAVHGDRSPDLILVGEKPFCGLCAAKKAGYKPWFFTGSPHGEDILALGLPELDVVLK